MATTTTSSSSSSTSQPSTLEEFKKARPPEYGEKDYWEQRYFASQKDTEIYDWYQDYDSCVPLKEILNRLIPKDKRILMVGCGNSCMGEQMFVDGYTNLESIDFAERAITIMKKRAQEKGLTLPYHVMDARNMDNFEDGSFDAAIDKGTIDAMMCGKNNLKNVEKCCSEVHRILKPGGVFIVITYGKPDSRLEYFEKSEYNWKVEYTTIRKGDEENVHHVYWMVKEMK